MDKRVADLNNGKKQHENTDRFVDAMAAAAFGVSIVTTAGEAGRFGLTVSAVTSVSAEPPYLLVCINRKNQAEQAITRNGRFVVNLLSDQQAHLAKIFAGRPDQGAAAYDFGEGKWKETHDGLPVLEDAAATFICDLDKFHDVGTHRIFLGRVIEATQSGASPLVYSDRKFGKFLELP